MTRNEISNYLDEWLKDEYLDPKDREVLTTLKSSILPDNTTNGDVIKAVAKGVKVINNKGFKLMTYADEWWDAPYELNQKASEV